MTGVQTCALPISSFHKQTFVSAGTDENTQALLSALDNRFVDVLGHPDAPAFPFDIDTVVKACALKGKFIEINNSSFVVRKGGDAMRDGIIEACRKYETRVVVNSDAHCPWDTGNVDRSLELLEKLDFPAELILNVKADNVAEYIKQKSGRDVLGR